MVLIRLLLKRLVYLDSYFIYMYIIINYRPGSIKGKIDQLLWELWPFFNLEKWFPLDIFSKGSILDSYFIYRYIIIKYRSGSIKGKKRQ